MKEIEKANFVDEIPAITVPVANFLSKADYISKTMWSDCKWYTKVGKYYASKDEKWIPATDTYSTAATVLRLHTGGFATGDSLGVLQITWYT